MKRLICVVLVLVFLLEASPIEALAESAGMITAEELAEAWALTGLDENAAAYHEGMEADGAMNAMQLAGWLDSLLDQEMNTLGNIHADLEQALADMQARNDGAYQRLVQSNEGQSYLNRSRELYAASENLREQLRWHKDQLESKSGRIRYMIDSLSEGQLTKAQKLRYSETIRAYTRDLKNIRNEITGQADAWDTKISSWHDTLNGRGTANDSVSAGLGDWISQVMDASAPSVQASSVRASTLYPDNGGSTLLGRLSPIRSALAEDDDLIHVIVLDDSVFILTLTDDDGPVSGATLTLRDLLADEKKRQDITAVTDATGSAIFQTKRFIQKSDNTMTVSMHAEIPNHREIFVNELRVACGEQLEISASKEYELPYVQSLDFNGHDIMLSEWNAMFSTQNDMKHTFTVLINHSAPVKLTLVYTDAETQKEVRKTVSVAKPEQGFTSKVKLTDYWKRKMKPGSKISFVLSDDSGYSENIPTKLNMVQAEFEQPFLDKDNKLLEALTEGMGFGFTIPESAGKPWAGSTLSLENIPILEKYMPHVQLDIDGSLMISVGYTPPSDDNGWKSKDQLELEEIRKQNEQDGKWKANKIAGGFMDMVDTHPKSFLGAAQADIGLFATLFARWPKDEDGRYNIHLDGSVGCTFTLGAEFTYMTGGFFASIGVTASLALAFGLGVQITSDKNLHPMNWSLDFGHSGFTVIIRLTVTVSLGLGIKGVASAGITGSASFSIVLLLTLEPAVSVSFHANVSLVFQILWVKYEISLWSFSKQIYPSQSSDASLLSLMARQPVNAGAEEEPEPQRGEIGSTPLSNESFPDLMADLAPVSTYSMLNSQVRYLNLNGIPFMLYIQQAPSDFGGCHVAWVNLTNGQTGNFLSFLAGHGLEPASASAVDPSLTEFAFDIRQLEDDPGMALLAFLRTREMEEEGTAAMEDGTVVRYDAPVNSQAVIMGIMEKEGRLVPAEGDERLPAVYAFDTETQFGYLADDIRISDYRFVKDRAECAVSVQEHLRFDQSELTTARRMGVTAISRKNEGSRIIQYHKDEDREAPKAGTSRTSQWAAIPNTTAVERGKSDIYTPIYALEIDPNKPDERTLAVDGANQGRVEIDSGNIIYFNMLSSETLDFSLGYAGSKVTDWIFYLEREQVGEGNERTVLKGLKNETAYRWVQPLETPAFVVSLMNLVKTDFDIAVPTPRFDIQKIYGSIYLYWLETGAKEKDDGPDTTRLSGIVFDPAGNVCMGKYVLAEFKSSQLSGLPAHVFLGADGKGYFMATESGAANARKATLYSFPLQIVPSVEIATTVLDSNVVKPGAFLDINIGLTNKGNAPIGVFDIQAVLGENDVFETMHMDTEHPVNNSITTQDGTAIELTGEHTFYRLEESSEPMVQHEWLLNRVSYSASAYTGITDVKEYSEKVTTDMLMPGAFTGYKTALKIPADWKGGAKDINLRHSAIAVQRNFVRAAALNSGVAMDASLFNLNDGSLGRIEYTLNSQGTALERAASPANAAGDAALYANSVSAGSPLKLNHDIHGIKVFHRVYDDPNGNERITITILNQAETHKHLRLYAELYPDRAEEPLYLDLPYYEDSTSNGRTHSIDMAMSSLLGGRKCRELRVVIRAKGVKETGLLDNEFILHFDDDDINDPFRFTLQPADRLAMAGETVMFTVAAAGGFAPYTYQWQVNRGLGMGWEDIADATADKLTLKDVAENMDGWLYRCVAADHNRSTATSESAALHLKKTPATGDGSTIIWYSVIALAAAALYLLLRRRRLRAGQAKQ